MTRKKSADKLPEGTTADIKLAMHRLALTGRNKKRKAKTSTKNTDSIKEKVYLFDKMQKGEASARELIYLSFLRGMTTKEQYLDFLRIEKECAEYDDEELGSEFD